jgi:general secretion pathway protein N
VRRFLLWLLLGISSVAITALAFFPAAFLVPVIEKQTQGRITLGDAQGTIWHGSAFIGSAPSGNAAITPLLPGRFSWRISPLVLIGIVEAELANPSALSNAIHATGSWHELTISPAAIVLPAERLASLGAPLNTLQPSGQMRLSWQVLRLNLTDSVANINGMMNLELQDITSRLSPIKPLGAYNLAFAWHGQIADVALTTRQGPMLLNGSGTLNNGHLIFDGTAQAAAGQEDKLANLLNLLGQRRNVNGKDIIVISL